MYTDKKVVGTALSGMHMGRGRQITPLSRGCPSLRHGNVVGSSVGCAMGIITGTQYKNR